MMRRSWIKMFPSPASPLEQRDFIFKHEKKKENLVGDVKIVLKNGMLLLMHHPTNSYWYHGLPPRKKCFHPRINLTFRKIKLEHNKSV